MPRPRRPVLKVLSVETHADPQWEDFSEKGYLQIEPRIGKRGWYYDRLTKACWVELSGSKAFLVPYGRSFLYNVHMLNVSEKYSEKHAHALHQLITCGLCTPQQRRLYHDIRDYLSVRKTMRDTRLYMHKHSK